MRTFTQYEAEDGVCFDTAYECREHEARLNGLTHKCPKCCGYGEDRTKPLYFNVVHRGPEPSSVDGWGAHRCEVHERKLDRYMSCEICNGRGWTAVEKKPIVRTEVIGYE
ncbi:hypothetical protein A9R05_05445 [Burkholderia sp. KK1]|nr:hypothetical protein A9R05_05445 [Burkholderia sp. KK1]